jgi:hypothetical protein
MNHLYHGYVSHNQRVIIDTSPSIVLDSHLRGGVVAHRGGRRAAPTVEVGGSVVGSHRCCFLFGGKCPEHVMEMFQMLIHCGDLEHEKYEDLSRN